MKKTTILYCDDQQRFIDEFRNRHRDDFDIIYLLDIKELHEKLNNMKKLPDIVLLDLYHPKDIEDKDNVTKLATDKLQELKEKIAEVKGFVDKTWEPAAIEVLKEIRGDFPLYKLPVLIYTQRGLLLLEDQKLREIEEHDGDWLIKDNARISPVTEAVRIRRFIKLAKSTRRIKRDIILLIVGVVVSALLSIFLLIIS